LFPIAATAACASARSSREFPADRAIQDDEDGAAAGAGSGTVQQELFVQHGREGGQDDWEMHWQAAGHDRVDGEFFGGDWLGADWLDARVIALEIGMMSRVGSLVDPRKNLEPQMHTDEHR
jgi:hypothetical protein